MRSLLTLIWAALRGNGFWMAWNLTLALVPLLLAAVLFRAGRRPTLAWWLGLVGFLVLLPNAPYVLTDVVHFVPDVRGADRLSVALAFMAQYGLFFLVGVECYVTSVVLLTRWLEGRGRAWAVAPAELAVHVVCAAGVYLGRVERLNSWDIVVRPDRFLASLRELASPRAAALTALTFVVVSTVYWTAKHVTLALASYRPRAHTGRIPDDVS
jgi:uncharacterized membrane protein